MKHLSSAKYLVLLVTLIVLLMAAIVRLSAASKFPFVRKTISGAKATKEANMSNSGKWFRVRVTDLKTGQSKANVNIPMTMVTLGLKMGAKFAPADLEGVDLNGIKQAIESGETGKLVDVEDEEKGEHVEVFVE